MSWTCFCWPPKPIRMERRSAIRKESKDFAHLPKSIWVSSVTDVVNVKSLSVKKKEKTSSKVFQAGHSRRIKEGKGFPLMDFNDCILYDINLESPWNVNVQRCAGFVPRYPRQFVGHLHCRLFLYMYVQWSSRFIFNILLFLSLIAFFFWQALARWMMNNHQEKERKRKK